MPLMMPCSGLGWNKPCDRRDNCANYIHWTVDPRSEFNCCTPTGQPFKFFVSKDIPVRLPHGADQRAIQRSLF